MSKASQIFQYTINLPRIEMPSINTWVSEDNGSYDGSQRRASHEGGTHRRPSRITNFFGRRRSSASSQTSDSERPRVHLSGTGHLSEGIATAHERRWQLWAERMQKRTANAEVNSLLNTLPEDIMSIYESVESSKGVELSLSSRKVFYEEFLKKASGFEMISCSDVEFLLLSKLGNVSTADLHNLMHENLERQSGSEVNESERTIDFQVFASILCDVLRATSEKTDSAAPKRAFFEPTRLRPLDPDSRLKLVWDIFCMILLLYCSFSVPYTIVFIPDGETNSMTSIGIFNLIVDMFFMIDMALCFVTSYEDKGFVVTSFRRIANNYFRTWFWPDLAGSFPFDTVSAAIMESYHLDAATNLGALKVMRIVKLVRAVKFLNKLNKLKEGDNWEMWGVTVSLGRALFILLFTAHVLGCFFGMFVTAAPDHNWLLKYNPHIAAGNPWEQYTAAIYWAIVTITTMGYGDVLPTTNGERLYCIVVALVGAVVFSHCTGTVSSLISQVAGVDDLYQERLRAVGEYMQFRELPPELQRRVRSHFVHCWRQSPAPFDEKAILSELSNPLRSQVLITLAHRLGSEVPLLEGFDDECIGNVLSLVKRTIFAEGDVIYSRGEPGKVMYMIVTGSVLLCWDSVEAALAAAAVSAPAKRDGPTQVKFPSAAGAFSAGANGVGQAAREIGEGESFGELGLFPDLLGRRRPDSAVARSWIVAYALSYDDLQALRGRHPEVVIKLRELADIRAIQASTIDPSVAAVPSAANARSSTSEIARSGVWGQQDLKMTIEKVKGELLRYRESTLLTPTSTLSGNPILRLLRPAPGEAALASSGGSSTADRGDPSDSRDFGEGEGNINGVGRTDWLELSVVVSDRGEVLCVENSLEGIARTRAQSFGFLVPGRSSIRVLRRDEVQRYHDPSARRQLFGCSIVCFAEPTAGAAAHSESVSSAGVPEVFHRHDCADFEAAGVASRTPVANKRGSARAATGPAMVTQLFTWTNEDFVQLRKAVGIWVGSTAVLDFSTSGKWDSPPSRRSIGSTCAGASGTKAPNEGLGNSCGPALPQPPLPTPSKLELSPLPFARPFHRHSARVGCDSSGDGDERTSSAAAAKSSAWSCASSDSRMHHQLASAGHALQESDSPNPLQSDTGPAITNPSFTDLAGISLPGRTISAAETTTISEVAEAERRLMRAQQEIDKLHRALEALRNPLGHESRDYLAR